MEDAAIVDLYWQRSDQAISETDRKYGKYCHTIAYNICASNEDAEECVNDTWFSAWNLMPDKRPSALSTFLGYITRNFALNRYKARTSKSAAAVKRRLPWMNWKNASRQLSASSSFMKKKNWKQQLMHFSAHYLNQSGECLLPAIGFWSL